MKILPSAIEIVNEIRACEPEHETRYADKMEIGDIAHQGDVYIQRIASMPEGKETTNRQLAPGTTQGSRHVAVGDDLRVVIPPNLGKVVATPFGKGVVGPAIDAKEFFLIKHPEHADHSLPAGCYQTYGQYDPVMDRRVAD